MFQGEGTLILVLLVTPEVFRNGSRIFMRELSAVLETIAFIKKEGDKEMIKAVELPIPTEALKQRSRRQVFIKLAHHVLHRRAADGSRTG